jgi:hypothetical protein
MFLTLQVGFAILTYHPWKTTSAFTVIPLLSFRIDQCSFPSLTQLFQAERDLGSDSGDKSCNPNDEVADGADFPGGLSSTFQGATSPRLDLSPEEIPPLLMMALQKNDIPTVDSGLKAMWEFAGGTTKFVFDFNCTEFIESAHETAKQFPTSFYGVAMLHGSSWEMTTPLNRVGGEDGWIATQVMKTISNDGRMRRWQWELRKNKRPPNRGAWLVESIGSSDRKGNFEPDN